MKLLFHLVLTVAICRVADNASSSSGRGSEAIANNVKNMNNKLVRMVLLVYQRFSSRVSKLIVVNDCEASFCPTDEIFAVLQALLYNSVYVTDRNITTLKNSKEKNGELEDSSDFGMDFGTSPKAETISADRVEGGFLCFVVVSDGATETSFISPLESLSSESLWNPEFFFIFVLAKPVGESSKEIENILRYTWENFEVLNCMIVYTQTVSNLTTEKIFVKKFDPFVEGGTMKDITRDVETSSILRRNPLNTHGFPLMISMSHFPPFMYVEPKANGKTSYRGPLYLMAESFARIFNFSIVTSSSSVTNISQWSIPKSYFSEPGYHANGYVLFRPEFLKVTTYPFSFDVSAFVVPKAHQMPMWMNAILPFTFDTWFAYLLFIVVISLASYFFSYYVFGSNVPNFLPLEIFRLLFVGASEHPLESTSIRLFFAANIVFNIIFNNAYTGSFSSYIMVPQFFKDYETLEEAVGASLQVAISFNVASNNSISTTDLATGVDVTDSKTMLIMQNTFFVDTYASAIEMAKTARNVCVMSTGLVGLYDAYNRANYEGDRPLLHVIPGGMMSLMYTYRTRPHFPFRSWLNAFVIGLADLGFTNKGRQELVSAITSVSAFADMGEEIIPLTLEHLQTYFYILVIGIVISLLVFFYEISHIFVRHTTLLFFYIVRKIKKTNKI